MTGLLLVAAGALIPLISGQPGNLAWIVFLLAGAIIQLYTSIAIPYAANKAAKDEVRKQNGSKNDNNHN